MRPRLLAIMVVPFFGSFLIWGIVTWLLWDVFTGWGVQLYQWPVMQKLVEVLGPYFVMTENPLVFVTVAAIIVMAIVPAAVITALFITSVLLVPMIVSELRRTEFPSIEKKSISIFAGTGTSIVYSLKYFATWIITLPLWIVIPFGPIIVPYLLVAWFNSRLFTWEVMTEIATPAENKVFMAKHSRPLFTLGLVSSLFYYVPFVNLVAPVIVSAAFARFCLQKYAAQTPSA